MSTLHAMLFFVGIPVLIFVVVTLLVMAPSLAKAPRYRVGQDWDAAPQWFGVLPRGQSATTVSESDDADAPQRQLASGATSARAAADSEGETGGASVQW